MIHGGRFVLTGYVPDCAHENAAQLLSGELAVMFDVVFNPSLGPGHSKLLTQIHPSRDRVGSPSLSHIENFSAEGPMARSVLTCLTAKPNTRSHYAASSPITSMTEQRRCEAA